MGGETALLTEFPNVSLTLSNSGRVADALDCAQMENEFLRKRPAVGGEAEPELASRNELEQKVRGKIVWVIRVAEIGQGPPPASRC